QAVLARELEVTLIVRRDAHDRAGAVLDENEVGDPHRYRLLGERIDGGPAGREAFLLDLAGQPRGAILRLEPLQVVAEAVPFTALDPLLDERMLRRQDQERGA